MAMFSVLASLLIVRYPLVKVLYPSPLFIAEFSFRFQVRDPLERFHLIRLVASYA